MQSRAYHSPRNAFPAIIVFNFFALALAGTFSVGLIKLIVFHIYLRWYLHTTTFDHILEKRKKKKEAGEYKGTKQEEGCCALKKRRDFKKHGNKNAENNNNNGNVVPDNGHVDLGDTGRDGFSANRSPPITGSDHTEQHEPIP
ncbi:hypothetical protein, conserved [Angomonas deanei]|uniref:Uncharacterized protein n=1 Tax=Angomonas deanei TaxID=59799 RepID=A0A7G2CGH0_9TRYP|nr:hypothetical protein, conserved [Angomonas deanei]